MKFTSSTALLLFWPAVLLVAWGELTPHPPHLDGPWGWDKVDHFTAYFGLTAMATVVLGRGRRLAAAVAGLIALGGLLEILQGFTGRDPDIWDFVANTVGALCGLGVGLLFLLAVRPRTLVSVTPAD